jgi:uncharacterized protein YbjT (DUF2867 family)
MTGARSVLVTGATGYIGGRVVPRLLERGHRVRVMVRDPRRIVGRPWADRVEVATGSIEDQQAVRTACGGMDAAYYLVHSMDAGADFAERDRRGALSFVAAAQGLARVIYLGGLVPEAAKLSRHLASRAEVGAILREGLPTVELRAGPVIGSGSASFEMVRYLTERLPAMIAPRWILNPVSPIAVRDVLAYLVAALERAEPGIYDVGVAPLTFKAMMEQFARVRGLRRVIVPVPVLAPGLAALWVGLVTPIPNRLAVPLIEGVVHPVIADTRRARATFPEIEPLPYRRAVELALERVGSHAVTTRWSGALGAARAYELHQVEGMVREVRTLVTRAAPERVFATFASLGGERGWLVWRWAWTLRGLFDRLLGGIGLRRGRRDPYELLPGDALDFWRVEAIEPPRLLRLRAEMKVPGQAWLQWEAVPEDGGSRLVQTALFAPRGLPGVLYWKLLYPFHRLIFSDLAKGVVRAAERTGKSTS